MGERGRKVFSHAGSDFPCFPEPKKCLVSGSEELEKLARAALGRPVRLPVFPRSACPWGLPSEENSLRLHLNKKLEPEAAGAPGVVWGTVGGITVLCSGFLGVRNLQISSSPWLLQLEPTEPALDENQGPDSLGRSPQQHAWLALACAGLGDCELLQALSFSSVLLFHSITRAPDVRGKAAVVPGRGRVKIRCSPLTAARL